MLEERNIPEKWEKLVALAAAFGQSSGFNVACPRFMVGKSELMALESYYVIAPHRNDLESSIVKDGLHLRYRVFSEQKGWEPPNRERIETDRYDKIATHCVLYARLRDMETKNVERVPVSYMRLLNAARWAGVTPDMRPEHPLAMLTVDGVKLQGGLERSLQTAQVLELSRLCVDDRFKSIRIATEGQSTMPLCRTNNLHLQMVWNDTANQTGGPLQLVGIAEPWLIRQIREQGYALSEIGDAVEHRGERLPFVIDVRDADNRRACAANYRRAQETLGWVIKPSQGRVIEQRLDDGAYSGGYRTLGVMPQARALRVV